MRQMATLASDRLEPAEPNRDELPRLESSRRILVNDSQKLLFRAHRKNQTAHWLELLEQSRRRLLGRRRNQDLVEWRALGPTARPIADTNADI